MKRTFFLLFSGLLIFQMSFSQQKIKGDIFINNKKVFQQKEEYVLKEGIMTKTVVYEDLSGKAAVKTKVTYDPNNLEFFDFLQEDTRTGQVEDITHKGTAYTIKYKKNKTKSAETKILTEKGFILSGALMSLYLKKNLDKLVKGEEISFSFPAASMQQFIEFSAVKSDDKIIDGLAHNAIKMYISTWVLRMLVDPMYFYFEKSGQKRLKQYEGRLTPSDEKGDPLVGKVVFSYDF